MWCSFEYTTRVDPRNPPEWGHLSPGHTQSIGTHFSYDSPNFILSRISRGYFKRSFVFIPRILLTLRSLRPFPLGLSDTTDFSAIGLHGNSWRFPANVGNWRHSLPQRTRHKSDKESNCPSPLSAHAVACPNGSRRKIVGKRRCMSLLGLTKSL